MASPLTDRFAVSCDFAGVLAVPSTYRLDWIDLEGENNYSFLFSSLKDKKDQVLANLEKQKSLIQKPVREVSQRSSIVNLLSLKRHCSKKTLPEIWDRLGLKEAYHQRFGFNKEDFWNSTESLQDIYQELCHHKGACL